MDEIESGNGGLVLLIVSWGREKIVAGYMHGLRPFSKVKDSLITANN
jgi:Na+-transporting NADH:ubiquinone oxidoreductase subunit NqrD